MASADNTWSPADNPYAIAVSEAQWWFRSVQLTVLRMHGEDDYRAGFSSRQLDARQLIMALCQLRVAENLQQLALGELDVGHDVCDALGRAHEKFNEMVPDLQHMRNGLVHFDEWTRGKGRAGPQKIELAAGMSHRDIASKYARFAYDPVTDTVTFGPYSFEVPSALEAAKVLSDAIAEVAFAVDRRAAADLAARTAEVLAASGLADAFAERTVQVSHGADSRVWVSLAAAPGVDRRKVAEQVVVVLGEVGLAVLSSRKPQSNNPAERLSGGEPLYVE